MARNGYKTLIYIGDDTQICEDNNGDRVLVLEREKEYHFYYNENGYPVSRTELEYALGWEVETVEVYALEDGEVAQYTFDIEEYVEADLAPVFDDEFATAPIDASRSVV